MDRTAAGVRTRTGEFGARRVGHPGSVYAQKTFSLQSIFVQFRTILFRIPKSYFSFRQNLNRFANFVPNGADLRDCMLVQTNSGFDPVRHRHRQVLLAEGEKHSDPWKQKLSVDRKYEAEAFISVAFVQGSCHRESEVDSFFKFRKVGLTWHGSHPINDLFPKPANETESLLKRKYRNRFLVLAVKRHGS